MRYLIKPICFLSCLILWSEQGFCAAGRPYSSETVSAIADGYIKSGDLDGLRRFMSAMESTGFGRRSMDVDEPRASREVSDFRDYEHDEESSSSRSSALENCRLALAPVLYAHKKTLTFADLKDDGSLSFEQRLVFSLDFSLSEGSESPVIDDAGLDKIQKLFGNNDLYNLQSIKLDRVENADEVLDRIFNECNPKKSLVSLTSISARGVNNLTSDKDKGKSMADSIFSHFAGIKTYPLFPGYSHLMRDGRQITSYWDRGECIETYAIPFSFYMSPQEGSGSLDWLDSGDYSKRCRISKDKKIMCHYRMRDPDTMAPFYLKIEVD
jgi:hypothetical protein